MSNAREPELNSIVSPRIMEDEFYNAIIDLVKDGGICTILKTGSSAGCGSVEAIVQGIRQCNDDLRLYCIELSHEKAIVLKQRYPEDFLTCYQASTVSTERYPETDEIIRFYYEHNTLLNQYSLERVLARLKEEIANVNDENLDFDGIEKIKQQEGIDKFDLVLIDGSDFTGKAELEVVYGAKYIVLNQITGYKNYENYQRLLNDEEYELVKDNESLRNGYAIFKHVHHVSNVKETVEDSAGPDRLESENLSIEKRLDELCDAGEMLFEMSKTESACKLFLQAKELDNYNIRVNNDLAACYYETGNMDLASKHLLEAYRQDQYDKTTIMNLHDFLLSIGKKEDIEYILEVFLSRHPDDQDINEIVNAMRSQNAVSCLSDMPVSTEGNSEPGGDTASNGNPQNPDLVLEDYDEKQSPSRVYKADSKNPSIHLICVLEAGQEALLANTLDSLSMQTYKSWGLTVIGHDQNYSGLFDGLDTVEWIDVDENDYSATINQAIASTCADWVGLIDAGDEFAPELLQSFASHINHNQVTRFLFSDLDIHDVDVSVNSLSSRQDVDQAIPGSLRQNSNICLVENNALESIGGIAHLPRMEMYDAALKVYERFGESAIAQIQVDKVCSLIGSDDGIQDNVTSNDVNRSNKKVFIGNY